MDDSTRIARLAPYFADQDPGEAVLDPSSLGDPQDYGSLAASVAMLQRGTPARDVFASLPATTQEAIARIDPDRTLGSHPVERDMPDLPSAAQLTPSQTREAQEVGSWVADYVGYASQASPLTPRAFHTAAGVFCGSLAIARRLYLSVGSTRIFPNLYILFVGQSTLPRKSTAMGVLRGVLRAADMEPFLLADRQTPEALTMDLGLHIPATFDQWTSLEQDRWLKERALAAQRGWVLEEASHLFDSFIRDYSAGLLPLVLDLYDAADEGVRCNTISRGTEMVRTPYISIFGATTYSALGVHLARDAHWHNGLWPRFALVSDDTLGPWKFWPEQLSPPDGLVKRLHFVSRDLLGLPEAHLITRPLPGGGKYAQQPNREVVLSSDLVSHAVELEAAARTHWEAYSRAVSYDLLRSQNANLPERLFASYGRFPTMLMKVAIVLAALDTETLPVIVPAPHVYGAQQIMEDWRASLHHVLYRGQQGSTDSLEHRVMAQFEARGSVWMSRRDLQRALHTELSVLLPILNAMVAAGSVEAQGADGTGATVLYRRRMIAG